MSDIILFYEKSSQENLYASGACSWLSAGDKNLVEYSSKGSYCGPGLDVECIIRLVIFLQYVRDSIRLG